MGWDVQYFATVEPQKRVAPHLHAAIRGSIPHEVLRAVTAATYLQVWWPAHDELVYDGDHLPVWDGGRFVDPETRQPLTSWADALEDVGEPAHVDLSSDGGRDQHRAAFLQQFDCAQGLGGEVVKLSRKFLDFPDYLNLFISGRKSEAKCLNDIRIQIRLTRALLHFFADRIRN